MTAEGGLEAAYEAPNIYSAIDALAARARTFAERRQRLLLEAADPLAQVPLSACPALACLFVLGSVVRCGAGR